MTETAEVLSVCHWNDEVFSFRCTRPPTLRFRNGEFIMIGLMINGKQLLRAYSIVSPNWDEELEFLSIKVQNGPLTKHLQHIEVGQHVVIGGKPVGTLTIDDLNPGKRLQLFASGTGLAPFMAIIQDPDTYEKFGEVHLHHTVRKASDLAYRCFLTGAYEEIPLVGDIIRGRMKYFDTVTRSTDGINPYTRLIRHTTQIDEGVFRLDEEDRSMICGSQSYLSAMQHVLTTHGFQVSPAAGQLGDFVIERAFVQ